MPDHSQEFCSLGSLSRTPSLADTAASGTAPVFLDGIIFSLQRHGGISVYFRELLNYLVHHEVKATLGIELPVVQEGMPLRGSVSCYRQQARVLERYRACRLPARAGVFHSSYYRLPARRGVPTVVTVHDFIYERFSTGPRRLVHSAQKRAAIRAAQTVICISESTRQDLVQWVGERPGQQILVIHNGVASTFRPLGLGMPSHPFVLYVGARAGYKNFKLVLDAMALLPDVELHCVGGGSLGTFELAGTSRDVRKRVRHLGFVTDESLNETYNRALCLVYPSSYEGFGIPVVEAMRAGCPVVCIDCTAVLEVGGSALTVAAEPTGPAIAEAIARVLPGSYRNTVVHAGIARAQKYSWQATHCQTLQVYRNLGASHDAA